MLDQNAKDIWEAATIAKRKGLAVAVMSGGYCAINRVSYDAKGKSTVEPVAAWLTGSQAIDMLKEMQ